MTTQRLGQSKTEAAPHMWSIASRNNETSAVRCSFDTGRKRLQIALLASGATHLAALLFLCWPARPVFLSPNWVARGEGGSSAAAAMALYLPQPDRPQLRQEIKLPPPKMAQRQATKLKMANRHNILEQEAAGNRESGSPFASATTGSSYGDEVKPALPVTFVDPQISPWESPPGVQGDVIVEITIDAEGNITETRLLQGVGYGIDQKVIAAARKWHFRPATRNGMAVPSKQDYRFHFPS